MKIYKYKGFYIVPDGSPSLPWSIYKNYTKNVTKFADRIGFGASLAECKTHINDNFFETDIVALRK